MDWDTASREELLQLIAAQQATIRAPEERIAAQEQAIAALPARVKELGRPTKAIARIWPL